MEKLEALNKRILRFIFADYLSSYDGLLINVKLYNNLCNKRIRNFLILLYKCMFFDEFPEGTWKVL